MPEYERDPRLPQVSGRLRVAGLQGEVKVYRDRWGVPHIFTENEHDLFFADGYVQAQDRLWQIVLFRALSEGRMAELFGEFELPGTRVMGMDVSTVAIDKRQRVMGLKFMGEVGEVMLQEKQPEILAQLQAYCDGINAYIEQHRGRLPLEFQVLYHDPEPFRVADVASLSRFESSMLTANLDMELLRYTFIKKFGEDMAWKLLPLHNFLGPTVVPKEMLKNRLAVPRPITPQTLEPLVTGLSAHAAFGLARLDRAVLAAAYFPFSAASNNWVVGPKITATGTAMLANDPHLIHLEPSLSYLMHLKGAGIDAYGIAFPGSPYIVMGHTRKLSWGATVTYADTQDLFVETVSPDHPGKYLYKGEWRDFVVRKDVIRVRPGSIQTGPDRRFKEIPLEIRHSIHGPIVNDMDSTLPKDTPPLALRWTGWDFTREPGAFETFIGCATLEEFRRKIRAMKDGKVEVINVAMMFNTLMRGSSIDDFVKAMSQNELLNMNWVAADAAGHIAHLPGGLIPIRKKGIGAVPVPGESGEYDWQGFIPLMETPHAIDPERGYMATANNQVVEPEWYPYIFGTNYDPGWRAWRIEELIQKLKPLTVEKMRLIQNDIYLKQAEVFVPLILAAAENKKVSDPRMRKALAILRRWDLEASIESPAPSIFFETIRHLVPRVLADDFKKKDYDDLVADNVSMPVQKWVLDGQSEFFDDRRTPGKVEDRDDALVGALADGLQWLTKNYGDDMYGWQWGRLHTIKWYHPMGFGPLKDLSIGPFPHPGGNSTIRNAESMGFGKNLYMCLGGPVMRHIIDMGDPDHALMVIDGSQSGQWLSPHYRDLHPLWYNSEYLTAEMRPQEVADAAESLLTLEP
jgi:penicillin amidase